MHLCPLFPRLLHSAFACTFVTVPSCGSKAQSASSLIAHVRWHLVLRPLDLANINAFLMHFPERAHLSEASCDVYDTLNSIIHLVIKILRSTPSPHDDKHFDFIAHLFLRSKAANPEA